MGHGRTGILQAFRTRSGHPALSTTAIAFPFLYHRIEVRLMYTAHFRLCLTWSNNLATQSPSERTYVVGGKFEWSPLKG